MINKSGLTFFLSKKYLSVSLYMLFIVNCLFVVYYMYIYIYICVRVTSGELVAIWLFENKLSLNKKKRKNTP